MSRSAIITITTLISFVAITKGAEERVPFATAPFDDQIASQLQHDTSVFLDIPTIRKIDLGDDVHIELILIPAGEFDMGSPSTEEARENDEGPIRRTRITRPFYIGRCEITQAQWKAVMGYSSNHYKDPNLPSDSIRWADATDFCTRLSERELEKFRLPTEAEWEFSCRAGSQTAYSFGDDPSSLIQYAWFNNNSHSKTHPVGQKKPNVFGLYDMHGNVWEWCHDWYDEYLADSTVDPTGSPDGSSRILRGGSWFSTPGPCRSGNRGWNTPNIHDNDVGFRVVMECPR